VETAAAAILASEHTILTLFDEEAIRQVLLAQATRDSLRDRAFASAASMTSEACIALATDLAAVGGRLSDVQVTTFPELVETRKSVFFLACHPRDKDAWKGVFTCLANRIYDLGGVGNASKAQTAMGLASTFLTTAIGYSVAAFEKLGLPLDVVADILTNHPDVGIAQSRHVIPDMLTRQYGTSVWTVSNMIATMDMLIPFATSLDLDTSPFVSLRELYVRAAYHGYGDANVSAVYEMLRSTAHR
jgi:3-hydroxyisobutyrate dehydrogenase-like beta-hydroxyacid dehydrogenase